jgi:hypothetical protein
MHPHVGVSSVNDEVNKVTHSVHDLRVTGKSTETSRALQNSGAKKRVSFGTNMSTEEDVLDGQSVEQKPLELMTAIERFHARKFKGLSGTNTDKRAILKAAGLGRNKKQRTPVKSYVMEALQDLVKDDVEAGTSEDEAEDLMELSKEGMVERTSSLKKVPKHLTGTHDKSHQAQ